MGFASDFTTSIRSGQCSGHATFKLLMPRPAQPLRTGEGGKRPANCGQDTRLCLNPALNSTQAWLISTWNRILNGPASDSPQQDQQTKNNDMSYSRLPAPVGGGTISEQERSVAETSAPTGQAWSRTCSHQNMRARTHTYTCLHSTLPLAPALRYICAFQ